MKRYNITADYPQGLININEADNGEWCRYEDVTETILFQAATAQIDEMKKHFHDQTLQLAAIKKARDELDAAPSYANWQEKHKLSSLLGMIK
jgi:hypothetical protein